MNTTLKPALMIAELIILEPHHSIVGLQQFTPLSKDRFEFTACRYLESDRRDFSHYEWNDVRVLCELKTTTQIIRFRGTFIDSELKQTDPLRKHPWAKLEDIEIIDVKEQITSFDRYNQESLEAEED